MRLRSSFFLIIDSTLFGKLFDQIIRLAQKALKQSNHEFCAIAVKVSCITHLYLLLNGCNGRKTDNIGKIYAVTVEDISLFKKIAIFSMCLDSSDFSW